MIEDAEDDASRDGDERLNQEIDQSVDTGALAQTVRPTDVPTSYRNVTDRAEAAIRQQGLQEFFTLRKMWSGWLIGWVSVLIAFQIILTFAIGLGGLDYTRYDWFLPLVTAQNFLQIVGMAIVVVRFLHSGTKATPEADHY